LSRDENLAIIGRANARDGFDKCGFARSIVADKSDNFAVIDLKIDIGERTYGSETLIDAAHEEAGLLGC